MYKKKKRKRKHAEAWKFSVVELRSDADMEKHPLNPCIS